MCNHELNACATCFIRLNVLVAFINCDYFLLLISFTVKCISVRFVMLRRSLKIVSSSTAALCTDDKSPLDRTALDLFNMSQMLIS